MHRPPFALRVLQGVRDLLETRRLVALVQPLERRLVSDGAGVIRKVSLGIGGLGFQGGHRGGTALHVGRHAYTRSLEIGFSDATPVGVVGDAVVLHNDFFLGGGAGGKGKAGDGRELGERDEFHR